MNIGTRTASLGLAAPLLLAGCIAVQPVPQQLMVVPAQDKTMGAFQADDAVCRGGTPAPPAAVAGAVAAPAAVPPAAPVTEAHYLQCMAARGNSIVPVPQAAMAYGYPQTYGSYPYPYGYPYGATSYSPWLYGDALFAGSIGLGIGLGYGGWYGGRWGGPGYYRGGGWHGGGPGFNRGGWGGGPGGGFGPRPGGGPGGGPRR